jgi:microsomal dipeptidase-like Zn-dependent dipeptidase
MKRQGNWCSVDVHVRIDPLTMTPLLDLHAHFPMHLHFPPRIVHFPPPVDKELEFWAANTLLNFQGGKPRVSLEKLLAGAPGGIGSVLYDPEDEFFRSAKPVPTAFNDVLGQINEVETELTKSGKVKIARSPADVDRFLNSGERFVFHCIEGAFAFGGNPANVEKAARNGVVYVTVAHLFYRGVATCENAIPFLDDRIFQSVLNAEQDPTIGLTELGRDITTELLRCGVLIDITHATQQAQKELFRMALRQDVPLISSHSGVRAMSDYPLNLTPDAILQIAKSNGVVGVILAKHWLRHRSEQFGGPDGLDLLFRTIRYIGNLTKNFDHIAIGTDLDGFIDPITPCGNYAETTNLVAAVQGEFPAHADKILYKNALRVLHAGWRGVPDNQ